MSFLIYILNNNIMFVVLSLSAVSESKLFCRPMSLFVLSELDMLYLIWCTVLNATFINISAISWRTVLVVKQPRVPGEKHWPWASNWLTVLLVDTSPVHPFCNFQSIARTHAILVIGLYELLDNPITEMFLDSCPYLYCLN